MVDVQPVQDSAGQIEYKWVSLGELFLPPCQDGRVLDEHKVDEIALKFNAVGFGTPILSYREFGNRGPRGEAYALISGQHRIAAARKLGMTRVFCSVAYGLTLEDEARVFVVEDTRKRQNVLQKFHLSRMAGDKTENDVFNIATANGFTIPRAKSAHPHKGDIVCVSALLAAYRAGCLGDVLRVIGHAFGRDRAGCRGEIVHGLSHVFRYRSDTVDHARLSAKLGALGSDALILRYRRLAEVTAKSVPLTMANVIIDVYNSNLRGGVGAMDNILISETKATSANSQSPETRLAASRLGVAVRRAKATGKTLAEARAEVAARRAAGEAV